MVYVRVIGGERQLGGAYEGILCKKISHGPDHPMRKQIINFKQGEDEGIDQASERFNELVEKEPKLGFTGDSISMSAGEDLMDKTLTEATRIQQKICKWTEVEWDWIERRSEEEIAEKEIENLAEISEEEAPKHVEVK